MIKRPIEVDAHVLVIVENPIVVARVLDLEHRYVMGAEVYRVLWVGVENVNLKLEGSWLRTVSHPLHLTFDLLDRELFESVLTWLNEAFPTWRAFPDRSPRYP